MLFSPRLPALFHYSVLSVLLSTLCVFPASAQDTTSTPSETATHTLTADAVQEAFVRTAERIKPSVVTIYAERTSTSPDAPEAPLMDPNGENAGLGTGMVVDAEGAILTNYHVVKNATLIYALFNADSDRPERVLATLSGYDEESDLAVLKLADVRNLHAPLRPVEFADSDTVRVGEWAIAVGAPFEQAQSITVGIVSAKSRYLDKEGRLSLQDYLQTDASINPGNSGGPLLNLDGKVIGVNTAILSPSRFNVGIGFAVPSNAVRLYWPTLKAGKTIERGFLGIRYLPLDDDVARELNIAGGMQIGALAKRGEEYLGPAHAAGLKEGDIITHVDGVAVTAIQAFRRLVAGRPPGTSLSFTVLSPENATQSTRSVTIVLDNWNIQNDQPPKTVAAPPAASPTQFSRTGLNLQDAAQLSAGERQAMGLDAKVKGIIITGVLPGSPADVAKIMRGAKIEKARLADKTWRTFTGKSDFLEFEKQLLPNTTLLLSLRDKQDTVLYRAIRIP